MALTTENKQDALVLQRQLAILANKVDDFNAKIVLNCVSTMVWAVAKEDPDLGALAKCMTKLLDKTNKE